MNMCNTTEASAMQAFLAGESSPRIDELEDRFDILCAKNGTEYVTDLLHVHAQVLQDNGTFKDETEASQAIRAVLYRVAN